MVKKIHPVEKPQHHEHDYTTGALIKFLNFINANRQAVLTAVIILIIIAAGFIIFQVKSSRARENSWTDLSMAVMANDPAALDTVASKYPGTNAALYALYYKADALYSGGDYAKSIPVFKEVAAGSNADLAALAQLSLAAAYQADGKLDDSIKTASDFLAKYPNHFALPQAYLTLALSLELDGKKDAAVNNYKILTQRFPKTYFGAFAAGKLKDFGK